MEDEELNPDFFQASNKSFNSSVLNISSFNASEEEYIPYSDRPETYIVPILFLFIFVTGVLGNSLLIFFFIKYPKMRNVPNTYILSLAMGDLLVIFFTVPFSGSIYVTQSWPFGEVICRLQEGIKDLSMGITVFSLTVLSADRYMAIVDPVNKRARVNGWRTAVIVTAFLWALSTVLAAPATIFSHIRSFPISRNENIYACYPFPSYLGEDYPKYNTLAKFLIFYFIPLIIISVFYILMARHLIRSAHSIPCEGQPSFYIRHTSGRKKVAKMVFAFVIIFAICFFPNHVFLMWFYFHPTSREDFNYAWNVFRIVGFCLGFANSCINPIALYCISSTIRKYYNRHLFCCKNAESTQSRTWTSQFRFYSSARNLTTKSEHIEMSTLQTNERIVL